LRSLPPARHLAYARCAPATPQHHSAQLQARLGELSGRSLAGALWAHAKLGHGPLRLLPAAAPHVRARAEAGEMNAQELANATWAYATAATRGARPRKQRAMRNAHASYG
jgi:hypothetical protein